MLHQKSKPSKLLVKNVSSDLIVSNMPFTTRSNIFELVTTDCMFNKKATHTFLSSPPWCIFFSSFHFLIIRRKQKHFKESIIYLHYNSHYFMAYAGALKGNLLRLNSIQLSHAQKLNSKNSQINNMKLYYFDLASFVTFTN